MRELKCLDLEIKAGILCFLPSGHVAHFKMEGNCLARRLIIGVRFVGLRETGMVNNLERRFLTTSPQLRIR